MTDLVARVDTARRAALEALQSAAAGASLCTLARERLDAAKYHEGAVVALGDAARALRGGAPLPDPDEWGGSAIPRAGDDPRWRAYLVGGRDALRALAEPARA